MLKAEMLKFQQIEPNTKQCIVPAYDWHIQYLRQAVTIMQQPRQVFIRFFDIRGKPLKSDYSSLAIVDIDKQETI